MQRKWQQRIQSTRKGCYDYDYFVAEVFICNFLLLKVGIGFGPFVRRRELNVGPKQA